MFSAGEIAEKFGISIRTIQRLDDKGVFTAKRNPYNNRRIYDHNDILKLQEVLAAKNTEGRPKSRVSVASIKATEAYTPTDALVDAITSTCKAIRNDLALLFKEHMPSLGLDLSSTVSSDEYIDNMFATTAFAKSFLTQANIEFIKAETKRLLGKVKEATQMAKPSPRLAEPVPGIPEINMEIEVSADRKQMLDLNMKNIDAIIDKELAGPVPAVSSFGVG